MHYNHHLKGHSLVAILVMDLVLRGMILNQMDSMDHEEWAEERLGFST